MPKMIVDFQSPFSEVPGYQPAADSQIQRILQRDYREKLAGGPEQERFSRAQEVERVKTIKLDPKTKVPLAEIDVPANAIRSRQGNDVFVESAVFIPTDVNLLSQLGQISQEIQLICEEHLMPQDFIIQTQAALHFAFGGVTSPRLKEDFIAEKLIQSETRARWLALAQSVQIFLDGEQPSMLFKEIKFNKDDGHLVFRATIEQAESFMVLKNAIGEGYQRYSDPEKVTTLATVLAVINVKPLTKDLDHQDRNAQLMQQLEFLFERINCELKGQSFTFDRIDWSESSNRMLQKRDMLGCLSVHRAPPVGPQGVPMGIGQSIAVNLTDGSTQLLLENTYAVKPS